MITELFVRYQLFPYERTFLEQEVKAFGGRVLRQEQRRVIAIDLLPKAARRLTYVWRFKNGAPMVYETLQARRESPVRAVQDTRYGPHGLHEYKGKFNPQTPRSLILQHREEWRETQPILDPFSGSGTTLIEARHLGYRSEGVELNPMGHLVTQAKVAWEHAPQSKVPTAGTLRDFKSCRLPPEVQSYLARWFPATTLLEIRKALIYGESLPLDDSLVARAVLSNLLRRYSWQDPADLRIRRRVQIPHQPSLLEALARELRSEWDERAEWARRKLTYYSVPVKSTCGDSRLLRKARGTSRIAGTVTSPPYATALPYVDTYRLSLVALGLVNPTGVLPLDRVLLGARDTTKTDEDLFRERLECLPPYCCDQVASLHTRVRLERKAGFRKRALPFALARYLVGIKAVLEEVKHVEAAGAPNLWVVGPNRTRLNGMEVPIPTPDLIGSIAEQVGFKELRLQQLDAYMRFSMHAQNSIRSETLLTFRA